MKLRLVVTQENNSVVSCRATIDGNYIGRLTIPRDVYNDIDRVSIANAFDNVKYKEFKLDETKTQRSSDRKKHQPSQFGRRKGRQPTP